MFLVLSDIHIGDDIVNGKLDKIFALIELYASTNNHIILNGDIFDLAKVLEFDDRHREFLSCLKNYGRITYIEGNHDWFMAGLDGYFGPIEIKKELDLIINEKKWIFKHGHQVDKIAMNFPKMNRAAIKFHKMVHDIFKFDIQVYIRKYKIIQNMLEKQETRLIKANLNCDYLVSGHTHRPGCRIYESINYINTGDWVINNSYLLIDNGRFELIK